MAVLRSKYAILWQEILDQVLKYTYEESQNTLRIYPLISYSKPHVQSHRYLISTYIKTQGIVICDIMKYYRKINVCNFFH